MPSDAASSPAGGAIPGGASSALAGTSPAPPDGAFLVASGPSGLEVIAADAVHRDGEVEAAGLFGATLEGPPDAGLAAVLTALRRGAGAGAFDATPRRPWSVVVRDRRTGDVTAVVNQAAGGSLLHAMDGERIVLGTHAPSLTSALTRRPELDVRMLARVLALGDEPTESPWLGVRRLPEGHLLRWRPGGMPRVRSWFTLPDPLPRGDVAALDAQWLEVFDGAVAALLPADGDVVATLSGGLDSSAVVASAALVMGAQGRRVIGITSAPATGVAVDTAEGWDADETDLTALLASEAVLVETFRNEARRDGVSLFAETVDVRGMPVRNPSNLVWMDAIARRAAEQPGRVMLVGANGNASFSAEREEQWAVLMAHRRLADVARLTRERAQAQGSTVLGAARRGVVRAVLPVTVRRAKMRLTNGRPDVTAWDLLAMPWHEQLERESGVPEIPLTLSQRDWHQWMTRTPSLYVGFSPAANHGARWSDPFADRELVRASARLPPESWLAGGYPRALARRTQVGRLPDAIRLRHRRGAQAPDWPAWLGGRRTEFAARLDDVLASPTVQELLDVDRARRLLAEWPDAMGREHFLDYDAALSRALVVGIFVRWWEDGG